MARTPLAWRNFINNKPRMFASVGGVAFAVVLMFIEMGFLNGLYDSQSQVVKMIDADLFIVNAHKEAVVPKLPFAEIRITRPRRTPASPAPIRSTLRSSAPCGRTTRTSAIIRSSFSASIRTIPSG